MLPSPQRKAKFRKTFVAYYSVLLRLDSGEDGAKIYLDHFNKTFGLNCKKVRMAVIAPQIVYRTAHRYAYALKKKHDILCYHFDEAPYLPRKLSNTSVERYRYMSENSMQFIYDHSNEIGQILKNS